MSSQDWTTGPGRRPDYRRFTVVEGDTPLPLGSTCRRKRLHSAGEDEDSSRSSRPNPEGSLSASELSRCCEPEEEEEQEEQEQEEEEQEEELRRLCQRCHIVTSQMNRQAAALKDPAYASFLFDKLQRLQRPRRARRAPDGARCDVCGASFHQLRRLALRQALGVGREVAPRPAAAGPATGGDWGELPVKQQRWSYEERRGDGAVWGLVQSTYLGGGGAKGLATVTPLPQDSQHHLEGVWRVSCHGPEVHQHRMGSSSGDVAAVSSSTEDVKPLVHSVATQTCQPPSAAASFFLRAAQRLSLSRRKRRGPSSPPPEASGPLLYTGGFCGALQLSPPAVPPCLLRAGSKVKDKPGMGKIRVMVRICSVLGSESSESVSLLKVDGRKKQLTLCETSAGLSAAPLRRCSASAPKTFTFDAIFTQDASQAEVCSGTVSDVIQSVVNGADGCIFGFGHANLGKTYTMIGRDCSTQSLGVAPTAVSWLFKVIEERQQKCGARTSVRVSAVEISGREETLTDLLVELSSSGAGQEAPGPAVSLQEDPLCGSQLQNQTELRATSAEGAAFFLDAALAARRSSWTPHDHEARRNSHFLFTLHLYQERQDKSSKAAVLGRSRLHLLDLGSCETDISRTREGGGGQCLSLSALGNVVLALANGAKHVPYRDSKLTMLLSESLGNINCQTTMIAHVSDSPANYMETLTMVQLASRIHHIRKKSKHNSSSSGGDSSCEEGSSHRPPHGRPFHPRTVALDPDAPLLRSSDPDYSSSSEHSCDTIIYVGPGAQAFSDRELSDNEGPPPFIPIIPSLNKKRVKDPPRSDGDHFKCNTFAELQERLDCIDGSEATAALSVEGKATLAAALRTGAAKPPPKSDPTKNSCTSKSQSRFMDPSKRTSADTETLLATASNSRVMFYYNPEPGEPEKVYLKGGVPKPSASPSLPRMSRHGPQPEAGGRTAPVGMSQQGPWRGPEGVPPTNQGPAEVRGLRAVSSGRCLDRDFLTTTITLQQPVELNGEDELVFTVVEELPHGSLVPDNGRPTSRLHQALASGSRPVSIISSINDEYDAYMLQQRADTSADGQEVFADLDRSVSGGRASDALQQSFSSSLNNNRSPSSPSSTQASPKGPAKLRASTLNAAGSAHVPHRAAHSSLPRKAKPTSPAAAGGKNDELSLQGSCSSDSREGRSLSGVQPPKSVSGSASSKRPGGSSNSAPRPRKAAAQRAVKRQTFIKLPRLIRGATTLGTVSLQQAAELRRSPDGPSATGTTRFSSLGKKTSGQKSIRSLSPPGTPVRDSSQEPKTRTSPSPRSLTTNSEARKSSLPKAPTSEEEFSGRLRAGSFSLKTGTVRPEHSSARTSSSLKTRGVKPESCRTYGSLTSPERSEASAASRDVTSATSGGVSRSTWAAPPLGLPASTPMPPGKAPVQSGTGSRMGRGTIMGTKQAISRVANSRVSELAAASRSQGAPAHHSASSRTSSTQLPSPYSTITAPRRPQRCSSGHGSDNSSVLSGELPPAMGRTALFHHSGGSSGYESMIRDSETSVSSAHDSMSESGVSSANRSRASKSPKKRGNGFQRRRLIPSPLPDASSVGRREGGQWVDLPPPAGALKKPFEIKVYEIDAVEPLKRRKEELMGSEMFQDVEKGLLYCNVRLKMLERRQQQIRQLRRKHQDLKVELEEAKTLLMLPPTRWSRDFDMDQDLDQESQEYLEVLAQVTAELQYCVDLCKCHIMMETCFDITMTTAVTPRPGTQQEVEA